MKIDVLTSDGSQRLVTSKTVWGDKDQIGVGGAELALFTMCEEWTKRGDTVRLYNDPREPNDLFEQLPIDSFRVKDDRDVLVVFRSPNPKAIPVDDMKVWWSCDQYTVGDFSKFHKHVDRTVVISPFHQQFFESTYGIQDTVVTDLPVRVDDYPKEFPEKIPHRFLFSSVPDRGLDQLWRVWPLIRSRLPDAEVVITSDYRLWGSYYPLNDRYKARWIAREGFQFLGAVSRKRLIEEQLKAQAMIYPCTYDELFCIAVAEAQYAGVYPITTNKGALGTTNMGTLVCDWNALDYRGDEKFADLVANVINHPDFEKAMQTVREKAERRFSPKTILEHWDNEVFQR